MSPDSLTDDEIETRMRQYLEACNRGDADAIASHFVEDAVHYFPPGMEGGPFRGARTIGERWAEFVENIDSIWTEDQLLTDADSARGAVEWTHFAGQEGPVLRGTEWYEFDRETGLIEEIRAYFAAPMDSDLDRNELEGFDYAGRGYALEPPFARDHE
jgi:methyltransferase